MKKRAAAKPKCGRCKNAMRYTEPNLTVGGEPMLYACVHQSFLFQGNKDACKKFEPKPYYDGE